MKNEISNLKNCLTDRENYIRNLSEHWKSLQASTDDRLLNEKNRIDEHRKGIPDEVVSAIKQIVIDKLYSKFMEFEAHHVTLSASMALLCRSRINSWPFNPKFRIKLNQKC